MFRMNNFIWVDGIGSICIRNTTFRDVEPCIELILTEFNGKDIMECVDYIARGDCIAAEWEGKILSLAIIAMQDSEYNGYEIRHTVTCGKYRCNGIMTSIVKSIINNAYPENIYASCRYIRSVHTIESILNDCGFELIRADNRKWNSKYNLCDACPYYKDDCSCKTDLYLYIQREIKPL